MRINNEPIAKQVLGSRVKRRVLTFLLSKQEAVSERELARIIGVSHTAVNKAMRQLLELNVVRGTSIGSAMTWELNEKSFAYPYVKMLIEASSLTPLEHIKKVLKESIRMLNFFINAVRRNATKETSQRKTGLPLITEVYLIGSVAEGSATSDSDIDVLVLLEEERDIPEVTDFLVKGVAGRILDETGNAVSFHIYGKDAIEKNEPPWLRTAIEKGAKVL